MRGFIKWGDRTKGNRGEATIKEKEGMKYFVKWQYPCINEQWDACIAVSENWNDAINVASNVANNVDISNR